MAMRPEVKRRAWVIIIFSFVQWIITMAALHGDWWHLDKEGRVLAFTASVFGGAFVIMGAILYIVVKGNPQNQHED